MYPTGLVWVAVEAYRSRPYRPAGKPSKVLGVPDSWVEAVPKSGEATETVRASKTGPFDPSHHHHHLRSSAESAAAAVASSGTDRNSSRVAAVAVVSERNRSRASRNRELVTDDGFAVVVAAVVGGGGDGAGRADGGTATATPLRSNRLDSTVRLELLCL